MGWGGWAETRLATPAPSMPRRRVSFVIAWKGSWKERGTQASWAFVGFVDGWMNMYCTSYALFGVWCGVGVGIEAEGQLDQWI
jgi:hypothetical protein